MRKLILLLLLASPVSAQWANVGTNILGNRFDPTTLAHPADLYTLQFQLSTKKWIAAAGGGSPTGAAGGALTGTYPNPGLAAHATSHEQGGTDTIPLDLLGNPTDVTTLNATTLLHGLLRKLDGNAAHYMDGTGAWSTPAGSTSASTGFPETSTVQKFLVPLYIYPTLAGWTNYYATSPKTGIVIANPSNGPGGSANIDYTNGIAGMHTNGIQVVGYVHTRVTPGGAFRALATVEAEVDSWYSFYPTIDGIFFDEADAIGGGTEVTYFTALWNYVRAKTTRNLVILNPGTNCAEAYAAISDIIVTSENSYATYSGIYVVDAWTRKYPATHFCHIVHTCIPSNLAAAVNLTKNNRAGYVYITDDLATYVVNPSYITEAITSIGLVDGKFPMVYSGINATTNVSPSSVLRFAGATGIVASHSQTNTTEDITFTPTYGTLVNTFAQGNDSRLSDARTPTTHASTHLPGGTDALTTATAVSVGAANATGSAASFARSDHTHAVTDLAIASEAANDGLRFNGANWVREAVGASSTVLQVSSGGIRQWGTVTSAMITDGTIANVDVSNTAALAYSKLSLTGSVVFADLAAAALLGSGTKVATATAVTGTGTTVVMDTGPTFPTFITITGSSITTIGQLSRSSNDLTFFNTATRSVLDDEYHPVIQLLTGSGTYTPTTNSIFSIVECVGAGGGSGGIAGSASGVVSSGGGGAGSYSMKIITAPASVSYTIGAAGTAGSAGANAGGAGGDTTFGASVVVGKGGSGSVGCSSAAGFGVPALGGVAGTGDITATGAPGTRGIAATISTIFGYGGNGGSSRFGGGGFGASGNTSANAGSAGLGYGAGGGGSGSSGTSNTAAGAAGSAGLIIVTDFVKR